MAIYASELLASSNYVPEGEEKEEFPASFKLKPMTAKEYIDVMAECKLDEGSGDMSVSGKGMRLALKYGLQDWENVLDKSEKPLKCTRFNTEKLSPILLMELAGEIINRSDVSEAEVKN